MVTKAIVALAVLLMAAVPAGARVAETQPLSSKAVHLTVDDWRDADNLCTAGNTGYYWTVGDWFTGNESYRIYCDPGDCASCPEGWSPRSVTIYLYWDVENTCALSVSASIELIDNTDPECPMPGPTVCQSEPSTVGPFSPAGLWAVTIPLPDTCSSLEDPFFAALHFHDTCASLPVLITDTGPCDACESWNNWGAGWRQLCEYGFPGNLSLHATIECEGGTPVEDASWGTIKGKYR